MKLKLSAGKIPRRQKAAASSGAAKMRRKIRIVIVDENPLCRRGLRDLLLEDERFDVVADADQDNAGLKVILEHKPDVAIIDDNLARLNGVELAGTLKAKNARS